VKFFLVPLLIIGMFVSFLAALVAMTLFTKTMTPEQVMEIITGGPDSTAVFQEFHQSEDRLEELFALAEEYKTRYEEQTLQTEAVQESLASERVKLQGRQDSMDQVAVELGTMADTAYQRRQEDGLKDLAKFYANVKPQLAAEILQQESDLTDTTVAMLMKRLPPRQTAKIMGSMNPEFAARITKIMKESAR